jgi:hypothetical protein
VADTPGADACITGGCVAACCAASDRGLRLPPMTSLAARRPRHHRPRLFEVPLLFTRARGTVAELVALVWLATEVVRLVRARVEAAGRGREGPQIKEGLSWRL